MQDNTLPKRFYKHASVESGGPHAFSVALDGRPLRTPEKALLSVPTIALAQRIAEEWENQGDTLKLQSMTLTRLANVVIDRTPETRPQLVSEFVNFAETDVLCYLATGPVELRERQEKQWRPLRDWAGKTFNIVLLPVEGIIASPQPQASLEAARDYAEALDNFRLTALVWACSLYGSCILALAVECGHLSAEEAFAISCLDEDWQRSQWGQDDEAQQAQAQRAREAMAIGAWFSALNTHVG